MPPSDQVREELAAAEERFERLRGYSAGAEVDLRAQSVVDRDRAAGIARAAIESRATTIVLDWDGQPARGRQVFGSVIDGVVMGTEQIVFVTCTREPAQVIERLVVVMPSGVELGPGLLEVVHRLEMLAVRLEAEVLVLAVGADPAVARGLFERVPPGPRAEFEAVRSFDELRAIVRDDLSLVDLVALVGARPGRPGWRPELDEAPRMLSEHHVGSFCVVYPEVEPREDERRFLRIS